jgi:hypothetical protein
MAPAFVLTPSSALFPLPEGNEINRGADRDSILITEDSSSGQDTSLFLTLAGSTGTYMHLSDREFVVFNYKRIDRRPQRTEDKR